MLANWAFREAAGSAELPNDPSVSRSKGRACWEVAVAAQNANASALDAATGESSFAQESATVRPRGNKK